MKNIKTMKKLIINFIGFVFTILGIVLLIKGDLTNGFLSMIVGELVDLEYRINELK